MKKILVVFLIVISSFSFSDTLELENDLINATKMNDLKKMEYLLNKGVDVNSKKSENFPPIMHALTKNNFEALKKLVEYDVNLDIISKGIYPLLIPIKNENIEIMKYLLENGADVNIKDMSGYSPLMNLISFDKNNLDMIDLLINNGAKLEDINNNGATPLILACYHFNTQVIKHLVDKNANVNATDFFGGTPLTILIWLHSEEGRKEFDSNNQKAFDEKENLFLIEYLLKNGAKVNMKSIKEFNYENFEEIMTLINKYEI